MIWDQFFTAELGVFPRKSAFSGVVQGGDSLFDRVGGQGVSNPTAQFRGMDLWTAGMSLKTRVLNPHEDD